MNFELRSAEAMFYWYIEHVLIFSGSWALSVKGKGGPAGVGS